MKKQIIKQIFLLLMIGSLTSCASITKLFPKIPRPFEPKDFNSEQWKSGDYQTRGEMLPGKLFRQLYDIKENPKEKILELLGKPDVMTEAICCYSGRTGRSTEKVELWIYFIETKENANSNKSNSENSLKPKALKIYFDTSINPTIGDRDGDHSYFPKIG